tara:strand:+ start:299 stop:574 length:276 start_codon:yes stop_codon:yes gene_type:complete
MQKPYKMKKSELRQIIKEEIRSVVNESKITIDDGDIEIISAALSLSANTMKRNMKLTDEEMNRLDNLLDMFSIGVRGRSSVDATASQLDRR